MENDSELYGGYARQHHDQNGCDTNKPNEFGLFRFREDENAAKTMDKKDETQKDACTTGFEPELKRGRRGSIVGDVEDEEPNIRGEHA